MVNIESNYTYHAPDDVKKAQHEAIREKAKELAYLIEDVCPAGREKDQAHSRLEEAVMWANAAIARG